MRLKLRLERNLVDCITLGDSIAKGVNIPGCETHARVGAASGYIVRNFTQQGKRVTVVSAGSNDPNNPSLVQNLRKLRSRIKSQVVWILPYNQRAAAAVRKASRPGDILVDLRGCPTRDRVHPSSYGCLRRITNASRTPSK
jgi:hypothetical protein